VLGVGVAGVCPDRVGGGFDGAVGRDDRSITWAIANFAMWLTPLLGRA
jgi:hypothetical protein